MQLSSNLEASRRRDYLLGITRLLAAYFGSVLDRILYYGLIYLVI